MPKKLDRCVKKVIRSSPKVNPYAVCKASINKDGKSRITITGSKRYIKYLEKHLRKEHPSTKKRMRVNFKK